MTPIPGATSADLKSFYDVIVVGAGVQGLALAYELAQRSAGRIAVVDAGYPGSGASGRNGELIRSAFSAVPWIRLLDHSVRRWPDLSAKLDFNVLHTSGGYTVIASTEDDLIRCQAAVRRQREWGLSTRLVDADDVRELVPAIAPDVVLGGVHQPNGGYAHHDAVVWAYARAAARHGVEIHPYTTVRGVVTRGGAVCGVTTDRGRTSTPLVVNAAGAFGREVAALAGVELPVERCRIQALVTESVRPFMRTAISPISLHGYGHQTSRGEFVGGTEFETPDHSDSLRGTRASLIDMAQKFVRLIPQLAGVSVVRHWAGLVGQTADMGPVLGPVPEVHGLYLSCGWLYGFMAAPGASELLAEAIVTGRVPELIEPFDIGRLRSGDLILDDSLIQKPQALGAAA